MDSNERGSALPMTIIVISLLMMISLVVFQQARRTADATNAEQGRSQTRLSALSAVDLFYANIAKTDTDVFIEAGSGSDPSEVLNAQTLKPTATKPIFRGQISSYAAPGGSIGQEFVSSGWMQIDGTELEPCPDITETCVFFRLRALPADQTAGVPVRSASLIVTSRQDCRTIDPLTGEPRLASCEATQVTLRLRERQAFTFMYYDERQSLDPLLYPSPGEQQAALDFCSDTLSTRLGANAINCEEVPYFGGTTGQDVITGPVHTNDEVVLTCGNPDFSQAGSVTSSGGPGRGGGAALQPVDSFRADLGPACSVTGGPSVGPTDIDSSPVMYPMPIDTSALQQVANPVDTHPPGTVIDLTGLSAENGYTANGTPVPPPGTGVIYVEGDAEILGTNVCLPVSVAAQGSIRIVGNVTYNPACPDTMIGIMASNAVSVIPQLQMTATGPFIDPATTPNTVQAAIVALGRDAAALSGASFYLGDPDDRDNTFYDSAFADPNNPVVLNFEGAIYSRFRGAFGTFDQDNPDPALRGRLLTGVVKNFSFDTRLRASQPPFLISPTRTSWIREGVADAVPLNTGT